MSGTETPNPASSEAEAIRARLLECARILRSTRHMEPDAQKALSELMTELAGCVDLSAATVPAAQLAETSSHLVQVLHEQQDEGLLANARHRLEEVAARAEAEAPVTTGVLRRLIDALSGIGV